MKKRKGTKVKLGLLDQMIKTIMEIDITTNRLKNLTGTLIDLNNQLVEYRSKELNQ